MREKLRNLYADSLFRNSFYLMLNTGVQAGFGFFFWLIAARIYSPSDVGLATALISAAGLTSIFSMLGFNNVIVRFLPTGKRKSEQLSTAFTLTAVASFLAAAIFLGWAFLTHNPTVQSEHGLLLVGVFVAYVLVITVNSMLDSAFIAYRSTKYVLFKNAFLSALKLSLLLIAAFFIGGVGFVGIVSVTTVATLAAFLLGYRWLISKFNYQPTFSLDKETIDETKSFAIGNYFGTLFGALPSTTLTLIVVSRLGAQYAAFFYIPSMIVTLLNVIPSSTSQSLFAEVSHNEAGFSKYFKDAVSHMFLFLIPGVIALMLLAGFILHIFGADYATFGTAPLRILALSSLIGAANYLGDTLLNIKKLPGMYLFMNALNALLVVVPAYVFAPYGLAAVAWSVLGAQVVTAIIYLGINWKLLTELKTVRI